MKANVLLADDELASRVKERLNNGHRDLRKLLVRADHGIVELSGPVGSFYLRQMAISKVQEVDGVQQINDAIQVDGHATHP
jgi:osmotically-inducible protein OsmY